MCSVEGATDHHMRQLAKRRRRGDLYTAQEGNFKETEQGRQRSFCRSSCCSSCSCSSSYPAASAGPAPIDPFFHVHDAVRRHLSQLLYRDEAANGDWSARIARLESACQDRDQGGLKSEARETNNVTITINVCIRASISIRTNISTASAPAPAPDSTPTSASASVSASASHQHRHQHKHQHQHQQQQQQQPHP